MSDPVSILWMRDGRSNSKQRKVFADLEVVYFIRGDDAVKIGTTNNIRYRFEGIQANSPVRLELLGMIHGGLGVERWCHLMCVDHRKHYEWFKWNSWVQGFVTWILAHGDYAAEQLRLTKQRTQFIGVLPQMKHRGADNASYKEIHKRTVSFGACTCKLCESKPWESW